MTAKTSDIVNALLPLAIEHHRAGRLADAERLYREVLAVERANPDALHLLGLALLAGGRAADAVKPLKAAVDLRPGIAEFHAELATALSVTGAAAAAVDHMRTAITLQPDSPVLLDGYGRACRAAGDLDGAESAYRAVLEKHPDAAVTWVNLGNLQAQRGDLDAASASFAKAAELAPNLAEAWANRGMLELLRGQHAAAEPCFARLSVLRPNDPLGPRGVGLCAAARGDDKAALAALEKAGKLGARDADFHFVLGVTRYRCGQPAAAIDSYRACVAIGPAHAMAWVNLAATLHEQGRYDEALSAHKSALATAPDSADAHNNHGNTLKELGQFDAAEAAYRRALELNAAFPEAWLNRGVARQSAGDYESAIAHYRAAVGLRPSFPEAFRNLGACLTEIGLPGTALASLDVAAEHDPAHPPHLARGNALREMGAVDAATDAYRAGLTADPTNPVLWDNFLFARLHQPKADQAEVVADHRAWGETFTAVPRPAARPRPPGGKLRIGFVSADFRIHSVAWFLLPLWQGLRARGVEIVAYMTGARRDSMTVRLSALADGWRNVPGLAAAEIAEQVRRDEIDMLVDLAGHTAGNRLDLFALRPAPVQVGWLGYPGPTGLAAMDLRLSDGVADPDGAPSVEPIRRIEGGFLAWQAPEDAPAPSLPGARPLTFGSFNALHKLCEPTVDLWAQVLAAIPDSRLVLKARALGDEPVAASVRERFAQRGIEAGRIETRSWTSLGDHLADYADIDIALDPVSYNGTTTSCEALWMGVPVLTRAGDRHIRRVGASLLTALGRADWIADTDADFIASARALAGNVALRAALRQDLRGGMAASKLCDGARLAAAFEKIAGGDA